jgi:hypothetical protein
MWQEPAFQWQHTTPPLWNSLRTTFSLTKDTRKKPNTEGNKKSHLCITLLNVQILILTIFAHFVCSQMRTNCNISFVFPFAIFSVARGITLLQPIAYRNKGREHICTHQYAWRDTLLFLWHTKYWVAPCNKSSGIRWHREKKDNLSTRWNRQIEPFISRLPLAISRTSHLNRTVCHFRAHRSERMVRQSIEMMRWSPT